MVEEEYKIIGQIGIYYRLYWWIILDGQKLSDTNQCHQLNGYIFNVDELTKHVEISELESHFVCNVISEHLHVQFVRLLELYGFI